MKKIFFPFAAALCILYACNNNQGKEEKHVPTTMAEPVHNEQFTNLDFANDRDPICHMPISAGVVDTAIIEGKIYGFCATECKDEFVKEHRK